MTASRSPYELLIAPGCYCCCCSRFYCTYTLNATINDNGMSKAHMQTYTRTPNTVPNATANVNAMSSNVQQASRQPASWWLACRIISISISIPLTHRRKVRNLETVITFSIDFRQVLISNFHICPFAAWRTQCTKSTLPKQIQYARKPTVLVWGLTIYRAVSAFEFCVNLIFHYAWSWFWSFQAVRNCTGWFNFFLVYGTFGFVYIVFPIDWCVAAGSNLSKNSKITVNSNGIFGDSLKHLPKFSAWIIYSSWYRCTNNVVERSFSSSVYFLSNVYSFVRTKKKLPSSF